MVASSQVWEKRKKYKKWNVSYIQKYGSEIIKYNGHRGTLYVFNL
jgi:hypothetical protein